MIDSMPQNRSVPCDIILPHIGYRDLESALSWLAAAFGFREHYRYGDPMSGAQVYLGNAYIMLKRVPPERPTPDELGFGTQSLTIFVDDVEAHYQRAQGSGARILEEPHVTCYGELQYAALDLEGHHWLFSRHAVDTKPEAWGAAVAG
jgi:uncharacterized glyoxalase superfamily protein PhnB